MKLCKDCKHAVMPNPLAQMYGNGYPQAMCSHPDASRSFVDGSLQTSCAEARGGHYLLESNKTICGGDAKLFEQAPEQPPAPVIGPYHVITTWTPPQSWWDRLKNWLD